MPTWSSWHAIQPSMFEPWATCASRIARAERLALLVYSTDLPYIHHAGFNAFAHRTAPELIDMLRGHGIRRGLVVDVGCGSGPLAADLIEAGYEVLGIDAWAAM